MLYLRSPFHPDAEWLTFLETLAEQAATAIDNAELFDSLQRSNLELALAYDATIIAYLHPALDIPYCHHEQWDGSSYPRGLKGEQIPLAARIFAVMNVWDALASDRPYRKTWPHEKAVEHVREQVGKHFDPKVVSAFVQGNYIE